MQEGLMNINDLSGYLQIPICSIYGMVERKEIPYIKIGRLIRFKMSEIESWLESKKVNPVSPEKQVKKIMRDIDLKKMVDKMKKEVYFMPEKVSQTGTEGGCYVS